MPTKTVSTSALLQNLQANLIHPNDKQYNRCVFLQFSNVSTSLLRTALAHMLLCKFRLTRAADSVKKTSLIRSFFLSYTGMKKLGLDISSFEEYNEFRLGMAQSLNEKVPNWEGKYRTRKDAMFLLASDDKAQLEEAYEAIAAYLNQENILEAIEFEDGERLYNEEGQHIEHFGFRDGITHPAIWREDGTLDVGYLKKSFLVEEANGAYGSFFVVQKYQQDIAAFEQKTQELAEALGVNPEFAAAQVVGRFKNGMPLLLADSPEAINKPELQAAIKAFDANQLRYDADKSGTKCPFHAHIRKMNPRDKLLMSSNFYPEFKRKFTLEILRRSIPYTTSENDKGMLFMSYQCDIRRQFEQLLKWRDKDTFPNGELGIGIDPLIGTTSPTRQALQEKWISNWGEKQHQVFNFADVVQLKGGAYFYCPSIPFLENLLSL